MHNHLKPVPPLPAGDLLLDLVGRPIESGCANRPRRELRGPSRHLTRVGQVVDRFALRQKQLAESPCYC